MFSFSYSKRLGEKKKKKQYQGHACPGITQKFELEFLKTMNTYPKTRTADTTNQAETVLIFHMKT